jgi:hypothetical protein
MPCVCIPQCASFLIRWETIKPSLCELKDCPVRLSGTFLFKNNFNYPSYLKSIFSFGLRGPAMSWYQGSYHKGVTSNVCIVLYFWLPWIILTDPNCRNFWTLNTNYSLIYRDNWCKEYFWSVSSIRLQRKHFKILFHFP